MNTKHLTEFGKRFLALTVLIAMLSPPAAARGGFGGGGGFRGFGGGDGFRGGFGGGFRGDGGGFRGDDFGFRTDNAMSGGRFESGFGDRLGGGAFASGGAGFGGRMNNFGGSGFDGLAGGGASGVGRNVQNYSWPGGGGIASGSGGFASGGIAGRGGIAGGAGFGNRPGTTPITGRGNLPSKLPSDGGFGGIAGNKGNWGKQGNFTQKWDSQSAKAQGQNIRNSFNKNYSNNFNNDFNRNNNINVNNFNGWHNGWGPYHGWGGYYGYGHYGFWGYPGGWYWPGWTEAYAWTSMGVGALTSFLGIAAIAGADGNGNDSTTTNVTYSGNTVYENGNPAGTAPQYYQQSQQLAALGAAVPSAPMPVPQASPLSQALPNQLQNAASMIIPTNATASAENVGATNASVEKAGEDAAARIAAARAATSGADLNDEFKPLGVYALAEPGQNDSNMIFQLAIDKKGIIRGNYFNQISNEQSQVYGALDKKTQRISWTIGQNNNTVFDTSLGNLTKDDSPVLVHYGPDSTRQMNLFKMNPPDSNGEKAKTQAG